MFWTLIKGFEFAVQAVKDAVYAWHHHYLVVGDPFDENPVVPKPTLLTRCRVAVDALRQSWGWSWECLAQAEEHYAQEEKQAERRATECGACMYREDCASTEGALQGCVFVPVQPTVVVAEAGMASYSTASVSQKCGNCNYMIAEGEACWRFDNDAFVPLCTTCGLQLDSEDCEWSGYPIIGDCEWCGGVVGDTSDYPDHWSGDYCRECHQKLDECDGQAICQNYEHCNGCPALASCEIRQFKCGEV